MNSSRPGGAANDIVNRLQNPLFAEFLIPDRIPSARRVRMRQDDPQELLQRYVILEYGSANAADAALAALKAEPLVLYAHKPYPVQFSWSPNDLYFPPPGNPPSEMNYQWGIHALNLPAAWDLTRGWSYIAVLDSGIEVGHEDLSAVSPPQFYSWQSPPIRCFSTKATLAPSEAPPAATTKPPAPPPMTTISNSGFAIVLSPRLRVLAMVAILVQSLQSHLNSYEPKRLCINIRT